MTLDKYLFLAIGFIYTLFLPSEAKAGCVHSDVNAQIAITSQNSPRPNQNNTVNTQFGRTCFGNSSHGNNLHIYSGTGQVRQERKRNAVLDSTGSTNIPLQDTPNVNVEINQQLHLPVLPNGVFLP